MPRLRSFLIVIMLIIVIELPSQDTSGRLGLRLPLSFASLITMPSHPVSLGSFFAECGAHRSSEDAHGAALLGTVEQPCCAPLADLKNRRHRLTDLVEFLCRDCLNSGLEPVLRNGSNLIDDCHHRFALTCDRHSDRGVRFGRCRQRDDNNRSAQTVDCIVRQHDAWPRLLDLGPLRWVKTNPPNIASPDGCVRHSSIPSSNDCHSSISRVSARSRFAARQAAARELSRSDNSCSSRRVTRRDRWRAGTAA